MILLDTISQRVNRAPLAYSGFWDAIKIKEDDLDKSVPSLRSKKKVDVIFITHFRRVHPSH